MKTPCIKVCVMDLDRGLCKGCLRTLDEIARWGRMSDAEREELLRVLDNRRSALDEGSSDVAEVPVPPLS